LEERRRVKEARQHYNNNDKKMNVSLGDNKKPYMQNEELRNEKCCIEEYYAHAYV